MSNLAKLPDITFSLPALSSDRVNAAAVAKVNKHLPELAEKTRAFDRQNSQTTISLMTLTMMTGHSPYRIMRQIMAEVEKRKMALAEAQVSHAKLLVKLERLENKDDPVSIAKFRQNSFALDMMESKVNGAFKDIATMIDAYENIKAKNGIDDWENGRAATATIEYTAQYGVHPQVVLKECSIYLNSVSEAIERGMVFHSNHLEDFLDEMAEKYKVCVDATAERLYGKADFTNTDYMLKLEKDQ